MKKIYVKKLFLLLSGIFLTSIGVIFMLQADIGLEPWSILQQGVEKTIGISFGNASIVVGAITIFLAILLKENFGIGTIGNIFLCGIFIDILIKLNWIPKMDSLLSGIFMMLFGIEILSLGTWLYMKAGLGTGPRDALMVALSKRTHIPVGICRCSIEFLCILTGWLMGGKAGIGTVIAAFFTGIMMNLTFVVLHFQAVQIHQENILETMQNLKQQNNNTFYK